MLAALLAMLISPQALLTGDPVSSAHLAVTTIEDHSCSTRSEDRLELHLTLNIENRSERSLMVYRGEWAYSDVSFWRGDEKVFWVDSPLVVERAERPDDFTHGVARPPQESFLILAPGDRTQRVLVLRQVVGLEGVSFLPPGVDRITARIHPMGMHHSSLVEELTDRWKSLGTVLTAGALSVSYHVRPRPYEKCETGIGPPGAAPVLPPAPASQADRYHPTFPACPCDERCWWTLVTG